MFRAAGALALPVALLLSCTPQKETLDPESRGLPSAGRVTYVALGDSAATTEGGARVAYPTLFALHAEDELGVEVRVRNEAVPGSTSAELLESLQLGQVRELVADAQVITVQTSGNDIAPGGDDSRARACVEAGDIECFLDILDETRETLEAIADELLELRDPTETLIRFTDYYNPLPRNPKAREFGFPRGARTYVPTLARAWSETICGVAERNGILCVRISHAFNGPNGRQSPWRKGLLAPDGRHLSDEGHRLVAAELDAAGYAPLASYDT